MNSPFVVYDEADLDREYPIIARSRRDAWEKVFAEAYLRSTGLKDDDPWELLQFAIGQSEPVRDVPDEQRTKAIIGQIRQFDPQFEADPKAYIVFRAHLPTYAETVQSLVKRFKGDSAALDKHLLTLHKVLQHGPFRRGDYNVPICSNKGNADLSVVRLIQGWITERSHPYLLASSLCFYSNVAIAQRLHRLQFGKCPFQGRGWPEAERVRKLCRALGLIRAKTKLIKNLTSDGRVVPYATHTR